MLFASVLVPRGSSRQYTHAPCQPLLFKEFLSVNFEEDSHDIIGAWAVMPVTSRAQLLHALASREPPPAGP